MEIGERGVSEEDCAAAARKIERAAEKIDKFCTYLENNGPAALHVADGKNVDLNRLFREVVG